MTFDDFRHEILHDCTQVSNNLRRATQAVIQANHSALFKGSLRKKNALDEGRF